MQSVCVYRHYVIANSRYNHKLPSYFFGDHVKNKSLIMCAINTIACSPNNHCNCVCFLYPCFILCLYNFSYCISSIIVYYCVI